MKKIEVYFTHWIVFIAGISLWAFLGLNALDLIGVKGSARFEDLSFTTNIMAMSIIASGVFAILGSNLISYILIARLLKIPRIEMETIIREHKKMDARENSASVQGFYKWCLGIAYNKKT